MYKDTGRWPFYEDGTGRLGIGVGVGRDEGPTQTWVIVISAGPDGELDTSADMEAVDYPIALDDDIIAHVK